MASQEPNPAFMRLPNGQFVDAVAHAEQQRTTEAFLNTSILTAGDVVAMQFDDNNGQPSGATFEITSSELMDVGIGQGARGPRPSLHGDLRIAGEQNAHTDVVLLGSSWGGSMRQPDVLATDRYVLFGLGQGREFDIPPLTTFEVFRPDEDGVSCSMSPNQLDAEMRQTISGHKERLAQVSDLAQGFGFTRHDYVLGSTEQLPYDEARQTFEDDRYLIGYDVSVRGGTDFTVVDKQTNDVTFFRYHTARDILEVGFTNTGGKNLDILKQPSIVPTPSDAHYADLPITTITTSNQCGFDITSYHPSDDEAVAIGVPEYHTGEGEVLVGTPTVQINHLSGEVAVTATVMSAYYIKQASGSLSVFRRHSSCNNISAKRRRKRHVHYQRRDCSGAKCRRAHC